MKGKLRCEANNSTCLSRFVCFVPTMYMAFSGCPFAIFFSLSVFYFFVRCVFGGPFLSRSQLDFFVKCFFSRNRVRAKFSLFSSVGWYEAMSACLECYSLFIMKTTNKKSFLNFD